MASFARVVLLVLIFWNQRCCAQSTESRITISPQKIVLTHNTTTTGTQISVTCQAPASGVTTVLTMNILKLAFTDPAGTKPTTLVSAFVSPPGNEKANLETPITGATVSGSIASQTITLTMSQAKCGNEGIYICTVLYLAGSTGVTATSRQELPLEVGPGPALMTVSDKPYGQSTWMINDTVTFSCTGSVGTVNISGETPDPQVSWVWEYKDSDNMGSFWETYVPQSDITIDPLTTDNIPSCSNVKRQTSSLQRHLEAMDSGRTYRCMVRRGSQTLEQFADSHTLGILTDDGATNTPPPNSGTSSADAGPIVGGVIGALIVIAVIVIIVYFLVIRPRRQKKDEEYTSEPKGSDQEAVPPYSTGADPSVIYSTPNKPKKDKTRNTDKTSEEKEGGKINKALDDEMIDEKKEKSLPTTTSTKPPTPDDNDDRRHGRRSHKDKKKTDNPPAAEEPHSDYPPYHGGGGDRRDRRHRDDDRYDNRRYDNDYDRRAGHGDDRRGGDRRRPRDADGYDDRQGRRNRGYEGDGRVGGRGHHSSSEDGGTDHSFVNTSHHSMGHGDPTMGTAI